MDNPTILITDDSSFFIETVTDILKKAGYKSIVAASDGNDALEKYKQYNPAIVLMDVRMPNQNGISAVQEIIKLDNNANIIMLSAANSIDVVINSLLSGAKGFIVKPFRAEKLLDELHKCLSSNFTIDKVHVSSWKEEYLEANRTNNSNLNNDGFLQDIKKVLENYVSYPISIDCLAEDVLRMLGDHIRLDCPILSQQAIDTLLDKALTHDVL